jgi:2'-5' RNA ligase
MKYFKNYELFLEMVKKDDKKKYNYGCVMLYFKVPELEDYISKIEDKDVYDEKGYGIETKSHITLLYGLHDDEIKEKEVFDLLLKYEYPDLLLVKPSLFENDDYDVLKFDVKYPKKTEKILHIVNKELEDTFPYTSDYPDYHPHCTIAYLKKGEGKKYVEMFKDAEITVHPEKIVYSKADGKKKSKYLK